MIDIYVTITEAMKCAIVRVVKTKIQCTLTATAEWIDSTVVYPSAGRI